jgi:hypothetical protein
VNTLEDRLRDAYRAAAQAVPPETIRSLDDQAQGITRVSHPRPRHQKLIPLAAAAAVAAVVFGAAIVVPLALSGHQRGPGTSPAGRRTGRPTAAQAGPYPPYFVALVPNGNWLSVLSATTGTQVARVLPPQPGLSFGALATGNGRTFVAAAWRPHVCATYFYQFGLTGSGAPTTLTPFAVPRLNQLVSDIAISGDGHTFGYYTEPCTEPPAAYLATTNLANGQTRRWSLPSQADVGPLSLTADGHLLAYNIQLTKLFPSVARVLPTDAAPGTAAQRSRTVAQAAQFGRSDDIYADAISPDGGALYFTTNATGPALGHGATWELRVANIATGQSRIVAAFPGLALGFTQDPSGRYLLLESDLGPQLATPRLTRLDLATGQVRYLRAAWIGPGYAAAFVW